jgi:glycosyltransferase involved in cell wall biosynthesis
MQMEREYFGGARAIFTMGHEAASSLRSDYSISAERIHVVGGGVALYPANAPVWPRTGHTIVFVGREVERKGLPELLEAFSKVRTAIPDATLKVVGITPPREFAGVEALGFIGDRAELSRLYIESTVFCLPARQESFGHVVVEAMAHALPCVVTSVGELPHMVRDGVNGYVVPVGDTSLLAERLVTILQNPALAASMGHASERRAQMFDWHQVARSMLEFIDQDDI